MKRNHLKIMAIPSLMLTAVILLTFSACGGIREGSNGDLFEKMAIFSLISFAVFAIFIVSFGGGKQKSRKQSKAGVVQPD